MTALRPLLAFAVMAALLAAVWVFQSPNVALGMLSLCLISAIMALGVNIQWGYAGLFNVGVMGFAALGGVAAVLVSKPPVPEAWSVGGGGIALTALAFLGTIAATVIVHRKTRGHRGHFLAVLLVAVVGYFITRSLYSPAVDAIEAVDPGKTGYLGGLGLPIVLSWAVGGVFAAGAAWLVGKIALGLRADYLAIATLGISEIIIAMLKNEDWLTRGVKNVTGLDRPVPYEVDLQQSDWFREQVAGFAADTLAGLEGAAREAALSDLVTEYSGLFVKICYAGLFAIVLGVILLLCVLALNSPWGRMVRAIRDNETAAEAMGKDVKGRHLQIFILGSAVVGIAGAMLATLDGQFTPGTYNPLRFTFLIWVMVVVGGSGNNLGAVVGAFFIWFLWVQAEPGGIWLIETLTSGLAPDSPLRLHLIDNAQHMRVFVMGLVLLLVMRFTPGGILPERIRAR